MIVYRGPKASESNSTHSSANNEPPVLRYKRGLWSELMAVLDYELETILCRGLEQM